MYSRSALGNSRIDDEGRKIRGGLDSDNDGWGDFHLPAENTNTDRSAKLVSDSWDDFDPVEGLAANRGDSTHRRSNGSRTSESRRHKRNDSWDEFESPQRRSRDSRRSQRRSSEDPTGRRSQRYGTKWKSSDRKINMNALEGAGFIHLYGLAPVLSALKAGRRNFSRPEDSIDIGLLEGEEYEHERRQRERKPEAQFSPWLFVQEQRKTTGSGLSADRRFQAKQVLEHAESKGVPVAYVDKGVLNTLSGTRPHQGYVLRCGKLFFESLSRLPLPSADSKAPSLWLVLDEVVDPQNLGALVRSAFFLGGAKRIGILVCEKNSAPPSPVVSAASAGALEVVNIHSTANLPRTLASAEQDGFRIVGASSSVLKDVDVTLYDLQNLPAIDDQPTILVLGSEGHGLRSLVARSCTEFVRIPAGQDTEGVDSLNVSVTGGILLWHLLQGLQ